MATSLFLPAVRGTSHTTLPPSPPASSLRVPSYSHRCDSALHFSQLPPSERQPLFVPRSTADFDDGGSFPEIHVAQYPRQMGNPLLPSTNTLSATVDSDGHTSYSALITNGTNTNRTVYSDPHHLLGHTPTPSEVALPSSSLLNDTTQRTQLALSQLLSTKVSLDRPTGSARTAAADSASAHSRTQFVHYTPHPSAPGYHPNASQRIIRMVPTQIDPMQPPKHMHRKAPRGPAEDPVPVLHAPPEKLSQEERQAWNVPACISNWKNSRGYTIPLDKRLAADGRGVRGDPVVNSNFAVLSESLYVAERQAREEVRTRAAVQKRLVMEERERREEELRVLANKARMERGGGGVVSTSETVVSEDEEEEARQQRDRLRLERRRDREKEYRLERAGMQQLEESTQEELLKKRRLENDRDVSEKIALGTHVGTGMDGGVDARLYSQNAGLDSGFGAEDEYNAYTRPMFDREGVTSSSIYRPTRDNGAMEDAETQLEKLRQGATGKFVPDKGFGGAEQGRGVVVGGVERSAPVQFEKGN